MPLSLERSPVCVYSALYFAGKSKLIISDQHVELTEMVGASNLPSLWHQLIKINQKASKQQVSLTAQLETDASIQMHPNTGRGCTTPESGGT